MKHTFYKRQEIQSLQEQSHKAYQAYLEERKQGYFEQVMISYRCTACFHHIEPSRAFHEQCETLLIEGHSLQCLQRGYGTYSNSLCSCGLYGEIAAHSGSQRLLNDPE